MKSHLKRLSSPKTWPIERKGSVFILRPYPAKPFEYGISLNLAFKTLNIAETQKEVKAILQNNEVLIDGKRVKDQKYLVGLMDVLTIPALKKSYRLLINEKSKLVFIEIDDKESKQKIVKIIKKTIIKGNKLQLSTLDSRSILVDNGNYKVGDSLLIEVPSQKIVDHFRLDKGCAVYILKGKYTGKVGIVEDVHDDLIYVKFDGVVVHTLKDYAYVVGKEKPMIKLLDN